MMTMMGFSGMRSPVGIVGVGLALLVSLVGCGSKVRTTTITIGDMQEARRELQSQVEQKPFFAERSASSPEIRIVVDQMQMLNLSSDQLSAGDRGYLMSGIFEGNVRRALRDKNVKFIASADRFGGRGSIDGDNLYHLVGTLRSAGPRSDGDGRVELYLMEYELIKSQGGAVVWPGEFTFKRYAPGIVFD